MKPKSSFVLYTDQYPPISALSLEQKGRLLEAFFRYHAGQDVCFDDPVLHMAFLFFRQTFERDTLKYEEKCRKNRENAVRRQGGGDRLPPHAVAADSDPEIDPDSDRESGFSIDPQGVARAKGPAGAVPSAPGKSGAERTRGASSSVCAEKARAGGGEQYLTKKKRCLSGKRLAAFNRFWRAFAWQKGKAEAADAWLDIPLMTDALVDRIVEAAERAADERPGLIARGQTPKWAQGWLSARRWEDDGEPTPPARTLDDLLAEQEKG